LAWISQPIFITVDSKKHHGFPMNDMTQITWVVLSAFLALLTFQKLKISPTLGYLLFGALLGPSCFHILDPESSLLKTLSEIGMALFIFNIGLEVPVKRLQRMWKTMFSFGGTYALLSALPISCAFFFGCGWSWSISFLIAFALSCSSGEAPATAQNLWRALFPIVLFQDVLAITLFIALGLLAPNPFDGNPWNRIGIGLATLSALVFFVPKMVERSFFQSWLIQENRDARFFFLLSCALGLGLLTEIFSFSQELGAFLAGVLLAENPLKHDLQKPLAPLGLLTLSVFFIQAGSTLDFQMVYTHPKSILVLVIAGMALKTLSALLVKPWMHISWLRSFKMGLLLSSTSEFMFIVLSHPFIVKHLDLVWQKILITSTSVSMILSVILWRLFRLLLPSKHSDPLPIYALEDASYKAIQTLKESENGLNV
jgi:monovalent cation:H+ antiporter-2, CPA2 family